MATLRALMLRLRLLAGGSRARAAQCRQTHTHTLISCSLTEQYIELSLKHLQQIFYIDKLNENNL